MPNFDGTGPRGEGPMTGGKRGLCPIPEDLRNKTVEELFNEGYIGKGFFGGYGFRRGFGRGRGKGHGQGRRMGRGWRR